MKHAHYSKNVVLRWQENTIHIINMSDVGLVWFVKLKENSGEWKIEAEHGQSESKHNMSTNTWRDIKK